MILNEHGFTIELVKNLINPNPRQCEARKTRLILFTDLKIGDFHTFTRDDVKLLGEMGVSRVKPVYMDWPRVQLNLDGVGEDVGFITMNTDFFEDCLHGDRAMLEHWFRDDLLEYSAHLRGDVYDYTIVETGDKSECHYDLSECVKAATSHAEYLKLLQRERF
jgi:hypothetical protein